MRAIYYSRTQLFSVSVAHARSLSTGSPNSSINRDWQSANKFSVRNLHIILIDHRILHGSVDFSVSQELLNLLDGHTFVYRTCCQRPSELMRMNFRNSQPPAKLAQTHLNTADFQSIVGTMQRNKQGGIFICSAIQIVSEVDFSSWHQSKQAFPYCLCQKLRTLCSQNQYRPYSNAPVHQHAFR